MRRVLLALCAAALPACSLEPQKMSTELLCGRYSAPLSTQRNDPEVRAELLRRGANHCVDPDIAGARGRNALATGLLGPLGGLIHSAAEPSPKRADANYAATSAEIAEVRRQHSEQQRRDQISGMVARGASDDEIRRALAAAPPN